MMGWGRPQREQGTRARVHTLLVSCPLTGPMDREIYSYGVDGCAR